MTKYSPEQAKELFKKHFEGLYEVCEDQGWGDPFSYARSREIDMAIALDHDVSPTYSGADAYDHGEPVEYKSTINDNINATYNGISVKDTWEDEDKYLRDEKLLKYKDHYYARYEHGKIVEMWHLTGQQVYDYLRPKLEQKYAKLKSRAKQPADPRLGATIGASYIREHGESMCVADRCYG